MEVTSVSPSATSPTEGDDLCEIDGSNVAIDIVTLLICLCGLVGNWAFLRLFRYVTAYSFVFERDFADFPFLFFAIPSALLFLVEDLSCTPILPLLYLSFLFQLSVFSCYMVFFQMFQDETLSYWKYYYKRCFRHEPPLWLGKLFYSIQSSAAFALFTVIPIVTIQCPSHYQEHCRAALISMHAVILLLFVVPTVFIKTNSCIRTVRDPSAEEEYKQVAIASCLVMLLTILLSLFNFLQQLGYIIVSYHISFLLTCIYSSIKSFIHLLVGRCWRPRSVGFFRLYLQWLLKRREENPEFMESLLLSQQRVFNGLEENHFFMESLRFSLQRICDGLQENRISMDSHRLSLKRICDGLKRKPFSVEPLQLPLQNVLEEPEENTAHSKDAPKDKGV